MDAAHAALRTYIAKVMAHVEEGDPASQALAAKLLQPVTHWGEAAPA